MRQKSLSGTQCNMIEFDEHAKLLYAKKTREHNKSSIPQLIMTDSSKNDIQNPYISA